MSASLSLIPLPYAADSHALMSRLSQLPRPVFLDSGTLRGPERRFDILSAEPQAWLQIVSGQCVSSDPDIKLTKTNLFNSIRLLRDKYSVDSSILPAPSGNLPFQGGLMGFLGYPRLAGKAELEFHDAFVGVYSWAVIVDHELQKTTLVTLPGGLPPLTSAILDSLHCPPATSTEHEFELRTDFERNLSRQQYDRCFESIKDYIRAGDCYQVNLTQRVTAACDGDPLAAFLRLRTAMPAPFSAYIGLPEGAILSVSPERFLRLSGSNVLTQPIKGTRPRHPDPARDQALAAQLQSSEKDQAENLMIVDLLRNDLGRVCESGTIQANQLFALHSFSNVHHLISSISGRLATGRDALDLLQACFPGGSVTGAPKLRAMAVIEELEPESRRIYCGTAFYLSANGNMDSSITIRSLLWEAGRLYCWAGGGIVDDSEAEAEYAECFHKINRIISSLSS